MESIVDDCIELTSTRNKGRPKGSSKRNKGFKGTPKKSNCVIQATSSKCVVERNTPLGLINKSNVCFFNSVIQVMYSLSDFRDLVLNCVIGDNEKSNAVLNMKILFQDIENATKTDRHSVRTHECVMSLNLIEYTENNQYDAEECLTQIINLVYPQVNNAPPENCLF